LTLIIAAVACLALVAGCGGGSSSTGSASEPGTTVAAETSVPSRGKPRVTVPRGPAPKRLVKRELIEGTGPEARSGDEVGIQYGSHQVGPVPPNSTLVYVIDLVALR
jgi:FKBP-type peptidyl-prolyl cis-trans isomerase